MYCDLDVHEDCISALQEALTALPLEGKEDVKFADVEDAAIPTTVFTITQHDGRVFRTTVTTEEIDPA